MTNRASKSLIVYEALGGIFGWVWIAASIGIVVATVGAIFFEWPWWNVLYAFLIGAIAKWLARGFLDNKRRVLFERQLIADGMSEEEAAQAWVNAYNRK